MQGQTRKLRKLVFLRIESGGGSVVQLHRCPATVIKQANLIKDTRSFESQTTHLSAFTRHLFAAKRMSRKRRSFTSAWTILLVP